MNFLIRFFLPIFLLLMSGYGHAHVYSYWKEGYYIPGGTVQNSEAEVATFEAEEENEIEEEAEEDDLVDLQKQETNESFYKSFNQAFSPLCVYNVSYQQEFIYNNFCQIADRHILFRVIRI